MNVYVHMKGDRVLGVHTNRCRLIDAIETNPGSVYTIAPLDPKDLRHTWVTPMGTFRKGERLWFWGEAQVKEGAAASGILLDYDGYRYGMRCIYPDGGELPCYYDYCSREKPEHIKD